jgi:hypothetical protein
MKSMVALLAVLPAAFGLAGAAPDVGAPAPATQCAPAAHFPAATTPIAFWSTEARCAVVPAGAGGVNGAENFGNKFPGEAGVYMGIVQVAIYDAAVALEGGYEPYAPTAPAPADASPEAAIATATHDTLSGLEPQLQGNIAIVDADYAAYLAAIPDGQAKTNGIAAGHAAAVGVLALRQNDGRGCTTTVQQLGLPPAGPGVWQPNATGPVLGLCLPGMRPLAMTSASQFRPDGPNALTSAEYAADVNQLDAIGGAVSASRTPAQTDVALFWTDHDTRQWDDGLLRLAAVRGLDLMQTARMMAMAQVASGDALIACFDAKYHFWFWRPYQAIAGANTDGNPATTADTTWKPLGATPNFPDYPAAHACIAGAMVQALDTFFGTDAVTFTLDSRAPGVTQKVHTYTRLFDVVKEIDWARVLVGVHFRNSDLQGAALGRTVGRYVVGNFFQPIE